MAPCTNVHSFATLYRETTTEEFYYLEQRMNGRNPMSSSEQSKSSFLLLLALYKGWVLKTPNGTVRRSTLGGDASFMLGILPAPTYATNRKRHLPGYASRGEPVLACFDPLSRPSLAVELTSCWMIT